MRRRDLLAGVASAGALGGAAAVATGNLPAVLDGGDGSESVEPLTIRTIDAPGSRDGEVTLPAPGEPTFVDFFATWCDPCVEQMPALAEANERIGDRVTFVSVTTEDVGGSVTEQEVRDWWADNDGDWLVAADVSAELAARFPIGGYPSARAMDASGRVRWATSGTHTADEFVDGIERALGGD
ncbi:TlpA family protein disulfide reductase [Halorubrum sp. DTA46]|uniref:TlpA family protein disulfide reductase n=1 Tax=Halorubrum sp. DTA46 TaxID=3402162 RepID=UPI003AB08ED2